MNHVWDGYVKQEDFDLSLADDCVSVLLRFSSMDLAMIDLMPHQKKRVYRMCEAPPKEVSFEEFLSLYRSASVGSLKSVAGFPFVLWVRVSGDDAPVSIWVTYTHPRMEDSKPGEYEDFLYEMQRLYDGV